MRDGLPHADAPVAIVGEFRLMLKIEVDIVAERERLAKEMARIKQKSPKRKTNLPITASSSVPPPRWWSRKKTGLANFGATLVKLKEQLLKLDSSHTPAECAFLILPRHEAGRIY